MELDKLLGIKDDPILIIDKFISELNIELNFAKLNIDIENELPKIKNEINIERLSNNPFEVKEKDFEKIFRLV